MITLGKLKLKNRVVYAPLAGCSDYPFRKISARHKPGLMFCEMVKMEPLLRGKEDTDRMLDYSEDMHPIGAQICGTSPEDAAICAKMVEDRGFDVLDLNCGCPVDKVTKDGSGSAMLKNPELIGDVIAAMVGAVKIPVTLKVRAGWDESCINAHEITKIAEASGAKAIFVHGRTRKQAYKGPANWEYIRQCKEAANEILVVGNGDVISGQTALDMFEKTGCDAVLAARGTMGQPWIVEDIARVQQGLEPIERSLADRKQALLDHLSYSSEYKSERAALIDMRRVFCWYLKNMPGARELRAYASKIPTLKEAWELIEGLPV